MAKAYVFSTLTCDQLYTNWIKGGADVAIVERQILVKGGAGVANDRIITPRGVVTEIDEEDIAILEQNEVFKIHQKNGFVMIERKAADPEKVAADMASRDGSAPLTPNDYQANDNNEAIQAPVVNKKGRK